MKITSIYLGLILAFFSCKDYNSLLNSTKFRYSNTVVTEKTNLEDLNAFSEDQKLYDNMVSLALFFENCNFINYLHGMNPMIQTLKILESMMNPDEKEDEDEDSDKGIRIYPQKKLTRRYTRKELLNYRYIIRDMRRQWIRNNDIEIKKVSLNNGSTAYYGSPFCNGFNRYI